MTTRSLLRVVGLLIWGFAGIPAALSICTDPACISRTGLAIWIGSFVVFGVAFFRGSRSDGPEGREAARLLAVQTAAALLMNTVLCTGFEAGLIVVVAVQLGLMLPLGVGL